MIYPLTIDFEGGFKYEKEKCIILCIIVIFSGRKHGDVPCLCR